MYILSKAMTKLESWPYEANWLEMPYSSRPTPVLAREERPSKGLGQPDIHLIDFEFILNEWEATSQGLGRPSIHLVDFEVKSTRYKARANVFLLFPSNFEIIWILFKILHISI